MLDIVEVLVNQVDYYPRCNYWKYLKAKLKENNQLLSVTTQLKLTDSLVLNLLLKQALTDKINDHEIFIKGIDYSYYYEQED